jgi:hypothetical protein
MTGPFDLWQAAHCQVPGLGHRCNGIPCQDFALTWLRPRPALCVLDGRGSAPLSHHGAQAAAKALRTLIRRTERDLVSILDTDHYELAALAWHGFAHRLYHTAALAQLKLAAQYTRCAADFEFTLSVAVIGCQHAGWLAIGDSPLVAWHNGVSGLVAVPETPEFANQTRFVVTVPEPTAALRCDIISAASLHAICAMTDGSASRLLHLAEHVPADAVRQIMERVAAGRWKSADLRRALRAVSWDHVTADDRCLAVLAAA